MRETTVTLAGKTHRFVSFGSLADLADTAALPCASRLVSAEPRSWYGLPGGGSATMQDAGAELMALPPVLGPEVAQLAQDVKLPHLANVRRRSSWGDHGDELNLDRVYSGRLDVAWRTTRKVAGNPPKVRVLCDVVAGNYLRAEQMRWRGVAACALMTALRGAGYSAALSVGKYAIGTRKGSWWSMYVDLIPFGAPIDVTALALGAVHPATNRGLMHAACPVIEPGEYTWNSNSSFSDAPAEARSFAGIGPKEKLLYVPKDCLSLEAAQRFVTGSLEAVTAA